MSIRHYAQKLRRIFEFYKQNRVQIATEVAQDLVDTVVDRVIQTGKNKDDDFFEVYSDSYLKSKKKRGRLSTLVPEPYPNFFDTGEMFKQVKPVLVSEDPLKFDLIPTGSRRKIMEFLNNKRITGDSIIMEFSDEELQDALNGVFDNVNFFE